MPTDPRAVSRPIVLSLAAGVSLLALTGCASSDASSSPSAGGDGRLSYGAIDGEGRTMSDVPNSPSRFAAVDLPDPSEVRLASGAPGPEYWQQRVDYDIDATLDVENTSLSATAGVTYHNNSPHTLEFLWIQLEQNLFRPDSIGYQTYTAASRGERTADLPDFEGGYTITGLSSGGRDLEHSIYDTLMRVELPRPIEPGGRFEFSIGWSFRVTPKDAPQVRMGWEDVEQGRIFEFAQWFPHVCVYDDVDGWNTQHFLGVGEFHTNFGRYTVNLTVPHDYLAVGSGELMNPEDVLTSEQRSRLANAMSGEDRVFIVADEEVVDPAHHANGSGTATWRFEGNDMRTFAWAASDAFIWDAASVEVTELDGSTRRVLCQSFYPTEATAWRKSTEMVQHSIEYYSDWVYPYPYTVATNVNGPEGGMEYPTIVFCGARTDEDALFNVTDHEFAHQWFPMMVSNDERRHVWMDEGINVFMNIYSQRAWYIDRLGREDFRHWTDPAAGRITRLATAERRQAIVTPPDLYWPGWRGYLGYGKPALGLSILRDQVLGAERFDRAFQGFTSAWAFKHPQPADFYRAIEEGAGADLDWFWRAWFMGTDPVDQGVDRVEQPRADRAVAHLTNAGVPLPVTMRVSYDDGSSEVRELPVEIWRASDRWAAAWDTAGRTVTGVELDPETVLPDVVRSNNAWGE